MTTLTSGTRSVRATMIFLVSMLTLTLVAGVALSGVIEGVARAASNPSVKILKQKRVKQNATAGGAKDVFLKVGGLQFRATCTDQGATNRVDVHVRSTKSGGLMMGPNGGFPLNNTWKPLINAFSSGPNGFAFGHDVLYKDGTYRHVQVSAAVNHGKDCVSRVVVTSA